VPEADVDGNQRAIAPRASLTERARTEICRRVGQDAASVAAVAGEFGVGWRTAMTAVRDYGTPRVTDPTRLKGVEAIGVDETAFQAASATRSTSFVTGIVDLTRSRGPARLLDVVAGRSAAALVSWINDRDPTWRAGIGIAALDPYRGYATALRSVLGTAVRVLDAFHVVRLGFAAVNAVRCRIQREQTGHRGRSDDPLYRIRRLLRRSADHHTQRSWVRLLAGLALGDTLDEQLARTWIAAQDLRLIYRYPDRPRAEQTLSRWLSYCTDSHIPELARLATTITPGATNCWPTSPPAGFPTDPPKPSTSSSKKSKELATDSVTSTTTGSGCCCIVASTGTLSEPRRSEDGYHAQWRRAPLSRPFGRQLMVQ
jgi:transposase